MYEFLIRQATLVSGETTDIAIKDGKIAAFGDLSDVTANKTLTLNNDVFVSAGWIDGHTHCYSNSPIYCDEPDAIGVTGGVTTVIDAGSTGADDIDDFANITKRCKTNVRALLNISRIGLLRQNELADINDIDLPLAKDAIERHPDFIVGLKARMSGSVVGENGLMPLLSAKALQHDCSCLPLMVHVGNAPPTLDDIVEFLGEGDILTHCFNGKPNRILTPEGKLRDSMKDAMSRGMLLDIGHGSASFSFDVAEQSISQGILPDTISSDIYCKNRLNGPVYGLGHLMSMFFTLGLSHQQIVDRVTIKIANALRLETKGQLAVGCDADLTLYEIEKTPITFTDTEGDTRTGEQRFAPLAAIVGGNLTLTDRGRDHHVFHS